VEGFSGDTLKSTWTDAYASGCGKEAEIPLLAHDFSKRATAIWRPSQDELLCTRSLFFFEDECDATEPLPLIEE
jgi:hypothetical protein